jgi:nucleoside-diphosphate-sugar epimerase
MVETNNQQTVLVTGATGAIGPRVVQALVQAGYRVRTFSLDVPAPGAFPDEVDVLTGDVTNREALQSAVQGVDNIIHLAALLHIVNPPPELRAKYEHVNVGGTAAVVAAALQANVRRVVLFSTIAVYGYSCAEDRILTEDSLPRPDCYYGQTKVAAEDLVLEAKRPDGQPLGVVLRLGAIYGSGIKGNYHRLVHALARGWFIPIGSGSNRRTLIYDKDAARATVLAMQHPVAAGNLYNVTDGQFHTVSEITTTICRALGRMQPRVSVPLGLARFAVGIVERLTQLTGVRPPITQATLDKYTEDVAVDGRRIEVDLGFCPEYDLKTGWQETIREMREHGEL